MMNKFHLLFGLTVLLFACEDQGSDKVINMQDVTPQRQQRSRTVEDSKLPDTLARDLDTSLLKAQKIRVSSIAAFDEEIFPDRFAPKRKVAYKMAYKSDSLVLVHWSYRDSVFTKNALYNWLDCFGKHCKSIRVGEQTNFQTEGCMIWVSDTSITYIKSNQPLKKEEWAEYFKSYADREDWRMLIEQKNRGKANWYSVRKMKFEPLKIK
jgi:lambda repressor-like predicted transcriptional regulator